MIALYLIGGGIILVNIILLCILSPRIMKVMTTYQGVRLDINNPYLPDYVIHKDQAIRFPLCGKHVYLRPMQAVHFDQYVQAMAGFFTEFKAYMNKVNMDKGSEDFTQDDIVGLMSLFRSPKARGSFLSTVNRTILQDKEMNREHIRWRHLKRATISEIVQLFIVLYDRNITSVKHFIASLLERLGEGSVRQKPGLGLWSLQDSQWMVSQVSQYLAKPSTSDEKPNNPKDKTTTFIEI